MSMSANWVNGRLRIDSYMPDPERPVVERGVALYLTAEQAETLRRVIDAGPDRCRTPVEVVPQ
jgi:hypothetical protein